MRAVLFHCRSFRVAVTELSNLPKNVKPEVIREDTRKQEVSNCIAVLVTVESKDSIETAHYLLREVSAMARDVGTKSIAIFPFAHLSNDLGSSDLALSIVHAVSDGLPEFNVTRTHFGSHKELLLDTYGHSRNVRYREF